MNQILQTSLLKSKKNFYFKIQLILSILLLFFIFFYVVLSTIKLRKIENFSNIFLKNYNITKLYKNSYITENSNIIGLIEIPSININYPIFSYFENELLKISPCKFYGPSPGEIGNLCIAGHNYDNSKFFSKINILKKDDLIIIYDNYNNKYHYNVYNIYEVQNTDLSPIYNYNKNEKSLTLVTCNNTNNKRIIVKAICN